MHRSISLVAACLGLLASLPSARAATVTVLHSFPEDGGDGCNPCGGLTLGGSTLYGMTKSDFSHSYGTIFSIGADGENYRVLRVFDRPNGDGYQPRATTLALSGTTLYGMTEYGGSKDCGTIFSIGTDGNNYQTLRSFANANGDGRFPQAGLLVSGSMLYGTFKSGGAGYAGGIFSYDTGSGDYRILHTFTETIDDGGDPWGNLILVGSTLYGMTEDGGSSSQGTVFSCETGSGAFSILHSFAGGANDGRLPTSGLTLVGSTLYGMTKYGGSEDVGTVFSIGTDGNNFSLLHTFQNLSDDGALPYYGDLVQSGPILFGATAAGGSSSGGTLFCYDMAGGGFQNLMSFDNSTGRTPYGSLTVSGSSLYGMTCNAGSGGYGTVFSVAVPELATVPGDANRDSFVDAADASILGSNWQVQSGATWAMGDFNFDEKVNDADAAILAAHWNPAAEGATPSVPEPGVLVTLLIGASTLLVRRGRCPQGLCNLCVFPSMEKAFL